jgi:hypothetical protein
MIKVMSALPAEGDMAVQSERVSSSHITDTAVVTTRPPYDSKLGLYSIMRPQKDTHLNPVNTPSRLQLGSKRHDPSGDIVTRWIKLLGPDTDEDSRAPFGIHGLSLETGEGPKKSFEKWHALTMLMRSDRDHDDTPNVAW